MRRKDGISLIFYILGTLVGVYYLSWAMTENMHAPEVDVDNFHAMVVGALLVIAAIIGIPYGTALISKLLHMITGCKLFGIVCIVIDIAMLLYFSNVINLASEGFDYWLQTITNGAYTYYLLIASIVITLISNITSIKE